VKPQFIAKSSGANSWLELIQNRFMQSRSMMAWRMYSVSMPRIPAIFVSPCRNATMVNSLSFDPPIFLEPPGANCAEIRVGSAASPSDGALEPAKRSPVTQEALLPTGPLTPEQCGAVNGGSASKSHPVLTALRRGSRGETGIAARKADRDRSKNRFAGVHTTQWKFAYTISRL